MKLTEKHILNNWEEDWRKDTYFMELNDGDYLMYDYQKEQFYLNAFNNEISDREANELFMEKGEG